MSSLNGIVFGSSTCSSNDSLIRNNFSLDLIAEGCRGTAKLETIVANRIKFLFKSYPFPITLENFAEYGHHLCSGDFILNYLHSNTEEDSTQRKHLFYHRDINLAIGLIGQITNINDIVTDKNVTDEAKYEQVVEKIRSIFVSKNWVPDDLSHFIYQMKGVFALVCIVDWTSIFLFSHSIPIFYKYLSTTATSPHTVAFNTSSNLSYYDKECPNAVLLNLCLGDDLIIEEYHRKTSPKTKKRVMVVCSGGMDSTVAAAISVRKKFDTTLLHFNYGCKATASEYEVIQNIAKKLGCGLKQVTTTFFREVEEISTGTALFNPNTQISDHNEWVPARNTIFLAQAIAIAEQEGYDEIWTGFNTEEWFAGHPDNSCELIRLLNKAMPYIVKPGVSIILRAPLQALVKHEIISLGLEIGAPLFDTISCYQPSKNVSCGECPACKKMASAWRLAMVKHPIYEGFVGTPFPPDVVYRIAQAQPPKDLDIDTVLRKYSIVIN